MILAPPSYRIDRIPERPDVIGQLDVPLTRKWKYIVIHHSYTDSGNEKKFDDYLITKLQEHVKTISDAYEKTLEQEKTDADMIAELQERVKTISAAYDKTINILNIEFERRPRRPW